MQPLPLAGVGSSLTYTHRSDEDFHPGHSLVACGKNPKIVITRILRTGRGFGPVYNNDEPSKCSAVSKLLKGITPVTMLG
jgi:hypothetical protein